jgi:hypothetical protein
MCRNGGKMCGIELREVVQEAGFKGLYERGEASGRSRANG